MFVGHGFSRAIDRLEPNGFSRWLFRGERDHTGFFTVSGFGLVHDNPQTEVCYFGGFAATCCGFKISSTRKRSVSSARTWMDAFKLSMSWELIVSWTRTS
jgi:hypothetical protein